MDLSRQYIQLFELLSGCKRLLVVAHQKPDGDALGASTALAHRMIQIGKEVTLFCVDKPDKSYAYLDHYLDFTNDSQVFDGQYNALVVLDSSSLRYCGIDKLVGRLSHECKIINFDHHKSNDGYGDVKIVDATASSTSEMMAIFFKTNNQKPDAAMATSLMTGILFDTSYFSNAATRTESYSIVSNLLSSGARATEIARALLKNKKSSKLNLWGTALSRLKYSPRFNLAFTYLKTEDLIAAEVDASAADGVINFLNGVCGGAEMIMILTQVDNQTIKGSFRSVKTDVSKIANLIGGGGHKLAAGFTISGKIIETAKGVKIA